MTPEKLRAVMEDHRLNAKKLADLLHVSRGAVYHWRNGTRPISKMTWDCLMLKLGKGQLMTISGNYWRVDDGG